MATKTGFFEKMKGRIRKVKLGNHTAVIYEPEEKISYEEGAKRAQEILRRTSRRRPQAVSVARRRKGRRT